MPDPQRTVLCGSRLCVEWGFDLSGRLPAKPYFDELDARMAARTLAILERLANGQPLNEEKFRKLEGRSLFEVKPYGHRFFGDFRPGGRFLISWAAAKPVRNADYDKAERLLQENDKYEATRDSRTRD
jgi:hypothetical protein